MVLDKWDTPTDNIYIITIHELLVMWLLFRMKLKW